VRHLTQRGMGQPGIGRLVGCRRCCSPLHTPQNQTDALRSKVFASAPLRRSRENYSDQSAAYPAYAPDATIICGSEMGVLVLSAASAGSRRARTAQGRGIDVLETRIERF